MLLDSYAGYAAFGLSPQPIGTTTTGLPETGQQTLMASGGQPTADPAPTWVGFSTPSAEVEKARAAILAGGRRIPGVVADSTRLVGTAQEGVPDPGAGGGVGGEKGGGLKWVAIGLGLAGAYLYFR